jgi:amino acid transporter
MSLVELLLGRPLRTEEQAAQRIGPLRGIPILGLDALASAAYGPEAALTILIPLGSMAMRYIEPISAAIVALILIVYFSYRQTIAAYPTGGGSYTVASQNLGRTRGLLAASALCVDYILNVAVAISTGTGAIVSAIPPLLPYTLPICLAILTLLAIVNLRGVREAGLVFMLPTYLFVAAVGGTIAIGVVKSILAHGHPTPVAPPPAPMRMTAEVSGWLLLRAFASGCTAMTGVEAVSNAVPIFREPRVKLAQRTLTVIIGVLMLLLAGIAYLSRAYGIGATPPGQSGYQSILSQIMAAVAGRGVFYYVAMASLVLVVCFSANTSFADFPRVCRSLSLDEYLPAEFAHLGRRLVYSDGIIILTLLAGTLLFVFGGITDRLIPLFAIGAFLAFTLSQWGMVEHWKRAGGRFAKHSRIVNGVGAIATGTTLVVVAISKFTEGAWITVIVIPLLMALFIWFRRNAERIDRQTGDEGPVELDHPRPPIVVIPLKRLDRVARKAMRLAVTISPDVQVLHVMMPEPNTSDLRKEWCELVELPVTAAGYKAPELVEVPSDYREFFGPLLTHIKKLTHAHPNRYVAVIVPELVEARWYHFVLHNHRSTLLKGLLLLRGGPRVVVINAPWYLKDEGHE